MVHRSFLVVVATILLGSISCKSSADEATTQPPTVHPALPMDAPSASAPAIDAASPKVARPIQFPPVVEKLHQLIEPLVALPRDDALIRVRACRYKHWWNDALGIEHFAPPAGVNKEWWYEISKSLQNTIFELDRDCGVKGWTSAEENLDHASELLAKMAAPKMAKPVQFPTAIEELRVVLEPLAALPHGGDLVGKRACKFEHWPEHAAAIKGAAPPPGVDKRRWERDAKDLPMFVEMLDNSCKKKEFSKVEEDVDALAHVLASMASTLEEQSD